MINAAISVVEWIVLLYFLGITAGYLIADGVALRWINRYMQERVVDDLPRAYVGLEPPVSILVPAYNEEATICTTVQALLQLTYPEHEIIVIVDGSTDETLARLVDRFALVRSPEAYRERIPTRPVDAIYRSLTHANIRVIEKRNGGKADALNAGINNARSPLFCSVDADSILHRDGLQRVARLFVEDTTLVAAGGCVRVANGCTVVDGFLTEIRPPRNAIAAFQVVEYLRAFLFGRLGWARINALPIISGAFGVFHRDTVVRVGGYITNTVGEDMELVVRLHRRLREERVPYRITYVPDPICWTEVPQDLRTLARQRIRWQRGLAESLYANRDLLFSRRGGLIGWLSLPFFLVFELLGPAIEVMGYTVLAIATATGRLSLRAFVIFVALALAVGLLLSFSAVLLEELSFHLYPRTRHVAVLLVAAVGESLWLRQLNSVWRFIGLVRWLFGPGGRWGEMRRTATWHRQDEQSRAA